eukprot:TRINITY_DN9349_c0_g1_i2.p1 TRINITY_DN9349_c0_g1~~TRINITY_DN9349_c0_g1_i2.p1  ORF type:complete len:122 (-),score=23.39 TRINITY_DN9349_c0_g1_i2:23-388(-)
MCIRDRIYTIPKLKPKSQKSKMESEQVIDESLSSVERSLRLADNTKRTAMDTMQTLDEQNEQLDRMIEDIGDIEEIQKKQKQSLRVIESPFGGLKNMVTRKKNKTKIETEYNQLKLSLIHI